MLAQESLRLWTRGGTSALGLRSNGVVYPVFVSLPDAETAAAARTFLDKAADQWCLMGPTAWVEAAQPLMPLSVEVRRVEYRFLFRPAGPVVLPIGPGVLVAGRDLNAEALFPLQEAYEKEEVLFSVDDFQPLASRLHFWKSLKDQHIVSLSLDGRPVAKAGTNALTARWAQIGGVYTRPEHRGQGFQRRLMAFLLGRLADQGRGACLFVKTENLPALRLYRSLGFAGEDSFTIVYGERRSWVGRLR